ncbi:MAG TPA: hypothetical protein VK075_04055 [Pseudogracilibacillus sp.]|nr:hypothetical protein [Pseudogracilibacillus sp.]
MKQAFELAMFEIKKSYFHMLFGWALVMLIGFIVIITYNTLPSPDPYHDIILLMIIAGPIYYFRRQPFKIPLDGKMKAAKVMTYYNSLPIKKSVLAKMQIVLYLTYFLPVNTSFIIMFYVLDRNLSQLSFVTFVIFLLSLLMVNFLFGLSSFVMDYGFLFKQMIGQFCIAFLVAAFILIWFYTTRLYGKSVTLLYVDFIGLHPFIGLGISFIVMIVSLFIFPMIAHYKLKRIDY